MITTKAAAWAVILTASTLLAFPTDELVEPILAPTPEAVPQPDLTPTPKWKPISPEVFNRPVEVETDIKFDPNKEVKCPGTCPLDKKSKGVGQCLDSTENDCAAIIKKEGGKCSAATANKCCKSCDNQPKPTAHNPPTPTPTPVVKTDFNPDKKPKCPGTCVLNKAETRCENNPKVDCAAAVKKNGCDTTTAAKCCAECPTPKVHDGLPDPSLPPTPTPTPTPIKKKAEVTVSQTTTFTLMLPISASYFTSHKKTIQSDMAKQLSVKPSAVTNILKGGEEMNMFTILNPEQDTEQDTVNTILTESEKTSSAVEFIVKTQAEGATHEAAENAEAKHMNAIKAAIAKLSDGTAKIAGVTVPKQTVKHTVAYTVNKRRSLPAPSREEPGLKGGTVAGIAVGCAFGGAIIVASVVGTLTYFGKITPPTKTASGTCFSRSCSFGGTADI